jgi:hypothetical protein
MTVPARRACKGTKLAPADGAAASRMRRWPRGSQWVVALLFLVLLPGIVAAQPLATGNPYKVMAGFLRNFAHYITWPVATLANTDASWRICVLGTDPYGDILDETFKGRTEQGRPFEIVRADGPSQAATCQIVFVGLPSGASRRAALAELASLPILTVGDAPNFLEDGGMIRFQVSDHVAFGVNLDRTRQASLKVQTKMLEVAQEVLENGTVRSRR